MAMTRQEQKEASSKRMLDAALGEFAEKGFSGSKITDIARLAGVAAGLVSQRFGTKEDLYQAVVENIFEQYKAMAEEGSLIEILLKLAEAMREGARTRSRNFLVLSNHFSHIDSPAACNEQIKQAFEESRFGKLVAQAIKDCVIMSGDPFSVFSNFVRSGLFLCRNCMEGGMELPSTADLLRIIRYRFDGDSLKLALIDRASSNDTEAEQIILTCSSLVAEGGDPEKNLNYFLKVLGDYYQASRVYIFEIDGARSGMRNSYEWLADGITTHTDKFGNVPVEICGPWINALAAKKELYVRTCDPSSDPNGRLIPDLYTQGVDCVMSAAFLDQDIVTGNICVDDPKRNAGNMFLLKALAAFSHGEILRRMRNAMVDSGSQAVISALSMDFDYVCYIDGKHNTITRFRIIPEMEKVFANMDPNLDSNRRFDAFMKAIIHPDDFDGFVADVNRDKLVSILKTGQPIRSRLRVILDGEVIHYGMKIVRDVANPDGYIFGLIDREKEFIAEVHEERRTEVMKFLSSQYTAIYYVDFLSGKFEVFSLSDRIKDDIGEMLKGATSFSDAFAKFVRASVHPDDQKDMFDCLMSFRTKLAHTKSFSFQFRRNYGGKYLYTEMKVVKIDDENQPVTAVALGFSEMDAQLRLREKQEKTLRSGIEILYNTANAKDALTQLMKLLVEYHESDCAYIFETNRDNTRIRMSYEWVCDGLEPIVDGAADEPIEQRSLWFAAFKEKGELVVNSVQDEIDHSDPAYKGLADEEVENFMCVPIISDGNITGFVGVDNAGYAQGNLLILRSIAALVSSEILRRKQSDEEHIILDKVSGIYNSVYFADLNTDYIRNYIISDEYRDRYVSIRSYDKYIATCIINDVCDEDCDKFRRMTSRDYIAKQFRTRDMFTINFIDDSAAVRRNYEMQIIKANAEGNQIVICARDTSEAVEHEKRIQKAQQEQLEILVSERTAELQEKNKALNRVSEDIIELLGNITEARDTDSGRHIRRVKGFTHILAEQVMHDWPEYKLNKDSVELMTSASALHDVGKIMIPDAILLKPGRFTPEEFDIMKSHTTRGCDILKNAPTDWSDDYLKMSMDICHYHHEKYDGSGYPEGLVGDEIPISAQIVSIADCFDALTTKRVYKDAYTPEEAVNMIHGGECGVFSEKLLSSFKRCEDAFFGNVECIDMSYTPVQTATAGSSGLAGTKILFAEDNDLSREVCAEILEGEGAIVTTVTNGREAVDLFRHSAPGVFDAILMDIQMPEMNGVEATIAIRQTDSPNAKTIPIIAVTGSENQKDVETCMRAGMNAYINKPVTVSSLTRILLSCMRDQSDALLEQLAMAVKMANKDQLTGVKNMTAYTDMIANLTESIKKDPAEVHFALVECDINNLKHVNDNYGHDVGDMYIKNCSALICGVFKHSPVFRIGGDEFVVILRGDDYDKRGTLMDELKSKVAEAEKIADAKHGKASLAAGIAVFDPELDDGVSTVFRRADGSMYNRKRLMKFSGLGNKK